MESNIISLTPIQNYLLSQQKDIWSTTQDSHQLHRKKPIFTQPTINTVFSSKLIFKKK